MTRFPNFARSIAIAAAFTPATSAVVSPLLVQSAAAAAPAPSEVDALLDRWQKEVSALKSFTCKFRQEKKVSFMRRPLVSTGSLKFRERKILWVTDTPAASFLSFDGKEARIYHPEFNTLEIYSMAAMGGSPTPPSGSGSSSGGAASSVGGSTSSGGNSSASFMKGGMPGFTGDFAALRQMYDVAILSAAAGERSHHLRFTPKDAEVKKEIATIEFKLDEALVIQEWRLVRANGDELHLTISDFAANAKVDDKELQFDVPTGVKVVRMGKDGAP
jgi:outer membrane lipoprotein-sorting protein